MDVPALLHDYLIKWVIEPVADQFLGIFDLNGRFGLVFLFSAYSVAYGLFWFRKYRAQDPPGETSADGCAHHL